MIYFVTHAAEPALTADDALAAALLVARGHALSVRPLESDWSIVHASDTVVLRSAWSYHHDVSSLPRWLEVIERRRARLVNGAATLRWNLSKRYLLELAARGFHVPDTRVYVPGAERTALLAWAAGKRLVVKPTISMSAWQTHRIDGAAALASALDGERELLVQEFVSAIEHGELSFLFFDGIYSHCVRKVPRVGDFRVQREHGGTQTRHEPDASAIAAALAVVAALPEPTCFVRIDGVWDGERLVVMEVEAIDPELMLRFDDQAPARFADALERRLTT